MTFGYDTAPTGACSHKRWKHTDATACMILFGYGSIRDKNTAEPNLEEKMIRMTQNEVEKKMDSLAWNTTSDLRYVSLMITQALREANFRIRESNSLLGSRSYVGGVICFTNGSNLMAIPFGGGRAYVYSDGVIKPVGNNSEGELIDDALGCSEEWKPKCFHGTVQTKDRLYLMSGDIALPTLSNLVAEYKKTPSENPNTLAMQIRTELKRRALATMEVVF